ncbi:MAG: TonB-dependent receptor [Candidatus Cloacimonetes bacterium]|nr:TonB-dependent receptor [Candidatus Cloacimonadota bacterium]
MKRPWILLILLLGAASLQAGITGKITGKVTDNTGEPLPGVNVIVLEVPAGTDMRTLSAEDFQKYNTRRGAATDFEGDYIISNVPPGIFVLDFSTLGYGRTQIENVVVSVDLTSRHDVVLSPAAIEGEVITITAERALVQVDQTFSASYVGSKELSNMPVTDLAQVVDVQAGVVDGHFRGGRGGEVLYLVDGIPVTDVYDGGRGVDVQVSMVQELQVISGTFNAEYGQAMSGVVNTITKDGGEDYEADVTVYSGDYVSNHSKQFWNIDELDPMNIRNFELNLSGPVPGVPALTFNSSGRFYDSGGWYEGRYLFSPQDDNFVIEHPVSGNQARIFNPEDVSDIVQYFLNESEPYAFVVDPYVEKLLIPELELQRHGQYTSTHGGEHLRDLLQQAVKHSQQFHEMGSGDRAGLPWVQMNTETRRSGQFKLTWELDPTSKLRASYIVSDRQYKDYDQSWRFTPDGRLNRYSRQQSTSLKWSKAFANQTFLDASLSHTLALYHHRLYDSILDPRYRNTEDQTSSGFYYYSPGGLDWLTGEYADNSFYVGTARVGGTENEHFSRRTDSFQFTLDVSRQMGKVHLVKSGIIAKSHRLNYNRRVVSFNNFDIVQPEGANRDIYTRYPWEGAAYLQDKMEFQNVTLNVGARMDVFDANWHLPADLTNLQDPRTTDTSVKFQLSPRVAIAYPITDTGVIHFSYGHFFQRPSFEQLYRNPDVELTGPNTVVGNPDLSVERTVQYEIGLQQQVGEDISLAVSLYSRDIRDLVSTDRVIETVTTDRYYLFTNRDFGTVQGIVLTLDKRFGNNFSAGLDYTWQVAKANAANADAARNAANGGSEINKYLVPLPWDRRHTLNATVNYDWQGVWGLGLLGTYGSGLPYTPDPKSDDIVVGLLENSGRIPEYINADLSGWYNLGKLNGLKSVQLNFQVKNLLDRLNEVGVFSRTGRAGYNLDWESTASEQYVNPSNYSRPREVIVGMRFSF